MTSLLTRSLPALAVASKPKKGLRLFDIHSHVNVGLAGADGGYNDRRDVLVQRTNDGVDYNQIWREYQAAVRLQNAERQTLIDFLTFPVTKPMESVSQLSSARFQKATEYGEPLGIRQKPTNFFLGYDFDWYDLAVRFTWQYLADADQAQVDALAATALDADNRLVFERVLTALYSNVNRVATINDQDVSVYALYNADGTVPPTYKTNVFDGTHNHYLVSGAASITPGDLDEMYEHLRHHGYGVENGVQQIVAVNSREGAVIRTFRIATGATYDFIPAQGQPLDRILQPGQSIAGQQPAGTYAGLNVIGAYGNQLVIEDDMFPVGYVANIGTGGRANLNNPIGIREHAKPGLRGLRLVKGPDNDYPLVDSFYMRGIGTGIRQRGGACVMQIKASGSYVPPTQYLP